MAKRPIFVPTNDKNELFKEIEIDFKYYNGFAISQKSKCITSLHESAAKEGYENILEVSTKSSEKLGHRLSAFNLMLETDDYGTISIESAFQGSKVFENGGPYHDIYTKDSLNAKRDERIKTSGNLQCFKFEGVTWELEPKSAFYDWIYIKALLPHMEYIKENLAQYDAFSDIEFNPKKSINCQARTCAILVSLIKMNLLNDAIKSPAEFNRIVYRNNGKQATFNFE
ncbi:DarT1-associated NADAR antitoxin family protein [Sulfurimonas hydrogeniphila]|uniref:DarT1-associated NADAR antitoxin family protein n=1 Tax=Sulfurimonas hydrogeniphila TaxID=2509341 RepID=UPI00125FFDC6|nr:hypothetical protein [Sulfurimonas hydrogeniphila]